MGVVIIRTPIAVNTASNGAANLASRSPITNLRPSAWPLEPGQEITGPLGRLRTGRMGGDARQVRAGCRAR
jgi:hypothetical protein